MKKQKNYELRENQVKSKVGEKRIFDFIKIL